MYKTFFNLQRNPFEITPDPAFMFPTQRHNEALAALYYGVIVFTIRMEQGRLAEIADFIEAAGSGPDALVGMAEYGSVGKETGDGGGNDLIAISTHGRGAVECWVMGSITNGRALVWRSPPDLLNLHRKFGILEDQR